MNDAQLKKLKDFLLINNCLQTDKHISGTRKEVEVIKNFITSQNSINVNPINIKIVDLDNNEMTDTTTNDMLSLLYQHSTIQEFYFTRNKIYTKSLPLLIDVIRNNPSIKVLNLRGSNLGKDGAESLATLLPKLKSLETLNLEDNNLTDAGIKAIFENLPACSNIKRLNFVGNNFGDKGVSYIADFLSRNESLIEFIMYSNQISESGIKALQKAIKNNVNIKLTNFCAIGNNETEEISEIRRDISIHLNKKNPIPEQQNEPANNYVQPK
jgi:Ran GTPase-activating protein (RanGAP) involved in mRNA processing and transport